MTEYDEGFDDGKAESCEDQCDNCTMCVACDRIDITDAELKSAVELICEQNDCEHRYGTGSICQTKDCRVFDLKLLVMKYE
uniref:Uncharacterized protein n=1 Tax=viral metagenome TaxID=1070528 RepID=A0A6H1ZLF3_9ZZZZ